MKGGISFMTAQKYGHFGGEPNRSLNKRTPQSSNLGVFQTTKNGGTPWRDSRLLKLPGVCQQGVCQHPVGQHPGRPSALSITAATDTMP